MPQRTIFLVLAMASALSATVAAPLAAQGQGQATPASGLSRGELIARAGFGRFDGRGDPQLPDQTDPYAFQLGLGWSPESIPYVALDFDLLVHASQYATDGLSGFLGTVDDETSITAWVFTPGVRLQLPPSSPFRLYATAGLGLSQTSFETEGTFLGLPTTANEETDGAVSLVLGGGAQVFFGSFEIHVDARRLSFRGDFEDFGIRDVELGGTMIIFGAGWRPGR